MMMIIIILMIIIIITTTITNINAIKHGAMRKKKK